MDRKEILEGLLAMLRESQEDVGEEADDINEMTRPIGELRSFDSLTGVMVTARCYEKFGIETNVKGISLFVGENKRGCPYALTVGEIADRIITLTKEG